MTQEALLSVASQLIHNNSVKVAFKNGVKKVFRSHRAKNDEEAKDTVPENDTVIPEKIVTPSTIEPDGNLGRHIDTSV
ncbi:MAG: hypothetical protein ACI4VX_00280 [Succinivibrionaceae bacterium]